MVESEIMYLKGKNRQTNNDKKKCMSKVKIK